MDGGGAIIGRDGNNFRSVVASLSDKMVIGNIGVYRVSSPDQDHIRVEPVICGISNNHFAQCNGDSLVVVPIVCGHVGKGRSQSDEEGRGTGSLAADIHHPGPATLHDGGWTLLRRSIDDSICDLRKGLVPAYPLPLALAALANPLHGILDPRGVVDAVHIAGALLAAPGIKIRSQRIVLGRIVSGLFFSEHNTILDVNIVVAGRLVPTVGQVRALNYLVPVPNILSDRRSE